ncbi:type II toxin-antitoxin system MqsR family toxin [Xylocopilactobacillus apicola]|uniref:Type II toxin-antitoxin system MqsR family toxin n=1 Tax=Xylocopilactobacillus apicola TaxID=2932184 RepID=A0AAU9DM98_9LACO|nr:type II toxin-antitoxin system MqsR family toxin [Xylocopilactobacillus apicola]BDR58047.1 hypothetical protein XA3_04880 [Xylocopilactobacillus apicola]
MNQYEILAKLKYLISNDKFNLINRRSESAYPISTDLVKEIVSQLDVSDFKKQELDRDRSGEFVWIYKTEFNEEIFYIKFKINNEGSWIKFISFHISN